MTTDERARQHHAAIRANIDDWMKRRISFAEFETRATALHAAARADGPEVRDALDRMILAALPGVGAMR